MYIMASQSNIISQFFCFAGVGVAGILVHYSTLLTLVQILAVAPVFSSTAGFVMGALITYLLNYRYTFRGNRSHRDAATKYFTVALGGLMLNVLIMVLATKVLILHYLLAQIITTGIVLIWNFSGNRLWTFR